ncbi:hypothetical protein Taro_009633 [Colocasia esculenta]|uniref:Short-chain dehydrogenase TIC 32, chloroplastic n=1 Tax=Colocasia esculenta TaxID=4460 RepID=A0A843U689_COLES|nr:hypothetical protein [Colocasia esculenta]
MLGTVKYLLGTAGPSGYGSKTTAAEVTEARPDLGSITAVITGATSGIGAETARVLAMRGARLVLPARNLKAAEETRARILAEFPGAKVIVMPLDLSSMASVRGFVARFESLQLPLHLLINNAGKFSHGNAISEDGIEMTFATNYLGHYLLTKLLLEKMEETARVTGIQGRIVNVSSSIHGWFSGDVLRYLDQLNRKKTYVCKNPTRIFPPLTSRFLSLTLPHTYHPSLSSLNYWRHRCCAAPGKFSFPAEKILTLKALPFVTPADGRPYDPTRAYALSKLANVLHTKELADKLKRMGANVTVNCVHPGIVRTRLTRDREGFTTDLAFFLASKLLKTIPQAAATTCYVATHPRVAGVSGRYFADCNETSPSKLAASAQEASRLWLFSEAVTSPSSSPQAATAVDGAVSYLCRLGSETLL